MKISLVVAAARNGVIGRNNELPWHLPADLKYFKQVTMGKPIVMGRRTWESLKKRPLPGRHNIVVTRQPGFAAEGATVVGSLADALSAAGDVAEVMIIGGAEIFKDSLPMADRLYLTRVHADVEGDTYLPGIDVSQWTETESGSHAADEKNPYPYSFVVLERVSRGGRRLSYSFRF